MKETSEERALAKLNGGGSTTLDVSRVFHGSAPEVASTTTIQRDVDVSEMML